MKQRGNEGRGEKKEMSGVRYLYFREPAQESANL